MRPKGDQPFDHHADEVFLAGHAESRQLDERHEKERDGFRILSLGNQQETANVHRAALQRLGEDEPRKPGVQEGQGTQDPAVQGIVGVIPGPIIGPAVGQEPQGDRPWVLERRGGGAQE